MSYWLTFYNGPRDGEQLRLDELPAQDDFDGYWVEDMIVNDRLAAVLPHLAVPNGIDWLEEP